MRVKQITNIDGFYKALNQCEGKVELITDERDVLNLASTLTQFIGLTTVFSNPNVKEYEIVCCNPEDFKYIEEFLVPVK
ncbi:MAG: polya polymerase [Hespellia sp.]|nr:polya polymerase [Hespellia sp.]